MRTWILVLALGMACRQPAPPPAEVAPVVAPSAFEYITWQNPADATGPMPTVVAMHGLGDRPEAFIRLYQGMPAPVRVVALKAPLPWPPGTSWFSQRVGGADPAALAAEMKVRAGEVAGSLEAIAAAHPMVGKPVVTGFSQGAMMSFAVAMHHPGAIAGAVPISGAIPAPLLPEGPPTQRVPVRALHGDADTVLALAPIQAAVGSLEARGHDVTLTVHPGVSHTVTAEMRAEVYGHLRSMLPTP